MRASRLRERKVNCAVILRNAPVLGPAALVFIVAVIPLVSARSRTSIRASQSVRRLRAGPRLRLPDWYVWSAPFIVSAFGLMLTVILILVAVGTLEWR